MTAHRASRPKSLLLIGTGLIGGSFALAAKANGLFGRIAGLDRSDQALNEALELGIVDERGTKDASRYDAACVAVPLAGIADHIREAANAAAVVFDVGSVKGPVIDALDPPPANFVPCHPIAGSERHGPAAATATLFVEAPVVMTPVKGTSPHAVATVRGFWEGVGGRVEIDSPARHDERFALLSHLPHLVAFAFMDVVERTGSITGAGSGFRDFTRIAAGDADVWRDILHANAPRVRRYLDELISELDRFGDAAAMGGTALRERIAFAARARRAFDRE